MEIPKLRLPQPVKFAVVGVINTAAGTAIMFGLYNLAGFGYWTSSALNYFLASILSSFLNKYWTFQVKEWTRSMIFLFALTIFLSYIIAYKLAQVVIYHILTEYSEKTRGNISMLGGMCFFTVLNYLGQRYIVFRKRSHEK
jgi:putative flippase GtrA